MKKKPTEENTQQEKVVRFFGLMQKGNPTDVHISELTSGNISIHLCTKRDGMEPLVTQMILTPATFQLLFDAMFRAAHGHDGWQVPNAEAPK